MSRNLDRLRRGERLWFAEAALRAAGLLLLAATYRLGLTAHDWETAPPPHPVTPGEFAVCLGTVVCLSGGLALAMFGPGLLRHVPIPRGNPLYWRARR
jgi:hypothetical protein